MTTLLKQFIIGLKYCQEHMEFFFLIFNPQSKFAIINRKQKLEETD